MIGIITSVVEVMVMVMSSNVVMNMMTTYVISLVMIMII